MKFEELKEGTPVICFVRGPGKISGYDIGDLYPVQVSFEDGDEYWYTSEGKSSDEPGGILRTEQGEIVEFWVGIYPEGRKRIYDSEQKAFDDADDDLITTIKLTGSY